MQCAIAGLHTTDTMQYTANLFNSNQYKAEANWKVESRKQISNLEESGLVCAKCNTWCAIECNVPFVQRAANQSCPCVQFWSKPQPIQRGLVRKYKFKYKFKWKRISNNQIQKSSLIASSIKWLHEKTRRLIREVVYDNAKKKMRKNNRDIHWIRRWYAILHI